MFGAHDDGVRHAGAPRSAPRAHEVRALSSHTTPRRDSAGRPVSAAAAREEMRMRFPRDGEARHPRTHADLAARLPTLSPSAQARCARPARRRAGDGTHGARRPRNPDSPEPRGATCLLFLSLHTSEKRRRFLDPTRDPDLAPTPSRADPFAVRARANEHDHANRMKSHARAACVSLGARRASRSRRWRAAR